MNKLLRALEKKNFSKGGSGKSAEPSQARNEQNDFHRALNQFWGQAISEMHSNLSASVAGETSEEGETWE